MPSIIKRVPEGCIQFTIDRHYRVDAEPISLAPRFLSKPVTRWHEFLPWRRFFVFASKF